MPDFSGADWIEKEMYHGDKEFKISPLGRNVADFLGELFCGIYHLDLGALNRVEWGNTYFINISIGWKTWSTYDFDLLTRLVFLSHRMALRVELQPTRNQYIRLLFHQRKRSGGFSERMPTLAQAVKQFEELVSIPEYLDQ